MEGMPRILDGCKLEKLKTEIRCILLWRKNGIDISTFLNEYLSMFGDQFPFFECGYRSAVMLLKSLPDAVKVLNIRGRTLLMPIMDKETLETNSMAQKSNTLIKGAQQQSGPLNGENSTKGNFQLLHWQESKKPGQVVQHDSSRDAGECCYVLVLPKNYPKAIFRREQLDEVVALIMKEIRNADPELGLCPVFDGYSYSNGACKIRVNDKVTELWIIQQATSWNLGDGTELKTAKSGDVLVENIKAAATFPGENLTPKEILDRLKCQNAELGIENWTIRSLIPQKEGHFAILSFPETCIPALLKKSMQVNYGQVRVKVKIKPKGLRAKARKQKRKKKKKNSAQPQPYRSNQKLEETVRNLPNTGSGNYPPNKLSEKRVCLSHDTQDNSCEKNKGSWDSGQRKSPFHWQRLPQGQRQAEVPLYLSIQSPEEHRHSPQSKFTVRNLPNIGCGNYPPTKLSEKRVCLSHYTQDDSCEKNKGSWDSRQRKSPFHWKRLPQGQRQAEVPLYLSIQSPEEHRRSPQSTFTVRNLPKIGCGNYPPTKLSEKRVCLSHYTQGDSCEKNKGSWDSGQRKSPFHWQRLSHGQRQAEVPQYPISRGTQAQSTI